jgi:hypothetical protein
MGLIFLIFVTLNSRHLVLEELARTQEDSLLLLSLIQCFIVSALEVTGAGGLNDVANDISLTTIGE